MLQTVCEINQCCGCAACKTICPQDAIAIQDDINFFNAVIDSEKCIGCKMCHTVCLINNKPQLLSPKVWYQGWAKETTIRSTSTSGGVARTLGEVFIKNGGEVCSCLFEKGDFIFKLANTISELDKYQGSKYVKSNPQDCYTVIKNRLKQGKKILFIGLPCQVAAVKNYVGERMEENLYTVDLICHGTPSVKLLKKFLSEHNVEIENLEEITFRNSTGHAGIGNIKIESAGVMDRYSIAFQNSICYTENCYQCKFAERQRVSDITLGDSWGSELNNEAKQGISLILCQTDKGIELISNDMLELRHVDLENAIINNPQLQAPCKQPNFFREFFAEIKAGKNFDSIVFRYAKGKCIKQIIKKLLIKFRFYSVRGGCMISVKNKIEERN